MQPEGIAEELSGAVASARGLLSNLLDLFGLEARRAGLTLVVMLGCGAAGALLLVAAWRASRGLAFPATRRQLRPKLEAL